MIWDQKVVNSFIGNSSNNESNGISNNDFILQNENPFLNKLNSIRERIDKNRNRLSDSIDLILKGRYSLSKELNYLNQTTTLLVSFSHSVSQYLHRLSKFGKVSLINEYLITIETSFSNIYTLLEIEDVQYIQENIVGKASLNKFSIDSGISSFWDLPGVSSEAHRIVIMDTGIDDSNMALMNQIYYWKDFIGKSYLISSDDPFSRDEMRRNIVGSVMQNEYDQRLSQLRHILVSNSEKTYVSLQLPNGNSSSQVAYKYDISNTYLGQPVQFEVLLTNDLTSIYIIDDLNYIVKPLLQNGGWNPDLFVDSGFSGNLQEAIDNGMLPRVDFNQKDEPMNFLKLVLTLKFAEKTSSNMNLIDGIIGLYDTIASTMRPDMFSIFMVKYEELLKREMIINNNLIIINTKTGTNSTWVEFFDDLILSLNTDMFRSSNPVANQIATKAFANHIYRDQILGNDMNDNMVYNSILGSKALFDNEFSEQLFAATDGSYPSYNDFYYEDINLDGDQEPKVNIWKYVDPFGVNTFDYWTKTDYAGPFDRLGDEKQALHNLVGINNVEFVYPSIAIDDASKYKDMYTNYYEGLGLISPDKGAYGAFKNSFDLSLSLDFFKFGVRNNYGTMPVLTRMYFGLMTSSNLHFNQGTGNYLMEYGYSNVMFSY